MAGARVALSLIGFGVRALARARALAGALTGFDALTGGCVALTGFVPSPEVALTCSTTPRRPWRSPTHSARPRSSSHLSVVHVFMTRTTPQGILSPPSRSDLEWITFSYSSPATEALGERCQPSIRVNRPLGVNYGANSEILTNPI